MKKILIVLACVLLLTGCGKDNEEVKEEISTLNNAINENKAKAEKDYLGNYYKVSGYILKIESDHVSISSSNSYTGRIKAYLPKDELIELNKDYKVTIVGKITDFKEEQHENYFDSYVIMKSAHYVTNEFEIDADIDFFEDRIIQYEGLLGLEHNENWWNEDLETYIVRLNILFIIFMSHGNKLKKLMKKEKRLRSKVIFLKIHNMVIQAE